MKSHIAKMEEEIMRVPILRNEFLANGLESNNVFKLDRTGKQVLKLPQSSRNIDIKLDHHHNQKGGTNESIAQ
jgi:hypothetical protein